jgi:hypothetical protein
MADDLQSRHNNFPLSPIKTCLIGFLFTLSALKMPVGETAKGQNS